MTSEITNIGRYDDSDFVVIPEFRLGIGACITKWMSVRAGYNCILWSDVARAASHLPPGLEVDPRNLPPIQPGGGPEPEFPGIRGSSARRARLRRQRHAPVVTTSHSPSARMRVP